MAKPSATIQKASLLPIVQLISTAQWYLQAHPIQRYHLVKTTAKTTKRSHATRLSMWVYFKFWAMKLDWRVQDRKNQYKVHYKSVKKRSYRREWKFIIYYILFLSYELSTSTNHCSIAVSLSAPIKEKHWKKLSAGNAQKKIRIRFEWYVGEQLKTSSKHFAKRQKICLFVNSLNKISLKKKFSNF